MLYIFLKDGGVDISPESIDEMVSRHLEKQRMQRVNVFQLVAVEPKAQKDIVDYLLSLLRGFRKLQGVNKQFLRVLDEHSLKRPL